MRRQSDPNLLGTSGKTPSRYREVRTRSVVSVSSRRSAASASASASAAPATARPLSVFARPPQVNANRPQRRVTFANTELRVAWEKRAGQRLEILEDFSSYSFTPAFDRQGFRYKRYSAHGDIQSDSGFMKGNVLGYTCKEVTKIVHDVYGVRPYLLRRSEVRVIPPLPGLITQAPTKRRFSMSFLRFGKTKPEIPAASDDAAGAVARQNVEKVMLSLPRTMLSSADMVVILNARGTVLLNPMFHNQPCQPTIVALATLAVQLWDRILLAVEHGDSPVTDEPAVGTTVHRRAWMFYRIIQMIRDDVHRLLVESMVKSNFWERRILVQNQIDAYRGMSIAWQSLLGDQGSKRSNYIDLEAGYQAHFNRVKQWAEQSLKLIFRDSKDLCNCSAAAPAQGYNGTSNGPCVVFQESEVTHKLETVEGYGGRRRSGP